jgi:signal transduction histidine kinase
VARAPGVSEGAAPTVDTHECFASDGKSSLVARVLAGGAPVLVSPEASPRLATTSAPLADELSAARSPSSDGLVLGGFRACVIVPLVAHGRTIGAVSLISFARGYREDDLALTMELAHRLALALDNARLYDEARRAVQVRDDVLAIVSHDLRNPLSTILTSTERLIMRSSDEARQSLERCQRAAQRMTRMISDLVDAASLDTGTLSLDRREHDVVRVIHDALDLLQPLAEARSITLEAVAALELSALCDRERVVQVLSNLIGNAIKFAPLGSLVRIAAQPWGDMVRISVADAGPGIAPELLPRIFDRYWHTRSSDNRHGAGLGLYIAKGIVEGHGGRIWVDSMLRHGSTFHFTLPAPSAQVLHVAH